MPANLPIQTHGDNYEPMELDMDMVDTDDRLANELPVLEDVQLDLASHIAHYSGLPRIYRLEFIADHCRSLRIEALTMALQYIKENTCNVKDYVRLFKKFQEARSQQTGGPIPTTSSNSGGASSSSGSGSQNNHSQRFDLYPDTVWIDTKTKQTALKFEKLESELKSFRATFIKENLRRAQDDLGDHYLDCGDLESAYSAYTKSRDYATSNRNQVNQCLNIIHVAMLLKRWSAVSNHVLRAELQPNTSSTATNTSTNPSPACSLSDSHIHPGVTTKLHCAAGLYELNSRRYKKAAKHFVSTNFDHFDHKYGVLAPVNIAVYGSLCALATYDRQELANHLINSASFKQFSELDPQLRDALGKFHESKYAACLSILQEIKNTLLLDMYLAPHVERLYRLIKNKAIIQYFEPYSSACMRRMSQAFGMSLGDLEMEIINLICDGHIKAKIDSHQKILYAKNADFRAQTFERAITMGKLWQRRTQTLITRTALIKSGLEVNTAST